MGDWRDELVKELDGFMNDRQKTVVIPATVEVVYENNYTVDVLTAGGHEYFDIRLKPSIDSLDPGAIIFPEIGSKVLIARIGASDNTFCVIAYSQVSKVIFASEQTSIEIDSAGILLKRQNETLKDLISDLIDQIKQITVTTAQGPSGVPINAAGFTAIQTRFNQLLKDS